MDVVLAVKNRELGERMQDCAKSDFDWLTQPDLFHGRLAQDVEIPADYSAWLSLDGSMTSTIAELYGTPPSVAVHYSGHCTLTSWEADLIDNADEKEGFARQVSLLSNSQRIVVARSVVRRDSAAQSFLEAQQSSPLGWQLFKTSDWRRLPQSMPLISDSGLIGRARVWKNARTEEPLVVEEFFLRPMPGIQSP